MILEQTILPRPSKRLAITVTWLFMSCSSMRSSGKRKWPGATQFVFEKVNLINLAKGAGREFEMSLVMILFYQLYSRKMARKLSFEISIVQFTMPIKLLAKCWTNNADLLSVKEQPWDIGPSIWASCFFHKSPPFFMSSVQDLVFSA